MRGLIICIIILLGCGNREKSSKLKPFTTILVGELVKFPLNVEDLSVDSSAKVAWSGHYRKIKAFRRLDFYYDWQKYETKIDSLGRYRVAPNVSFYGISISIANKAHAMDSVKKVLEKELHTPLNPMQVKHMNLNVEHIYHFDSPVYTCSPQSGVYVSLRRSSCWKGDYPYQCGRLQSSDPPASDNPENSLRISISYGLQPDEEERFALGSGLIWKRID